MGFIILCTYWRGTARELASSQQPVPQCRWQKQLLFTTYKQGHVGWVAKRFYRLTHPSTEQCIIVIEVRFYRWLSSKFFLGPTAHSVLTYEGFRYMNILS